MFEHFGLRDVFVALLKYVRVLIALLLLTAVAVLAMWAVRPETAEAPMDKRPDIFSVSAYYSVSATDDSSQYTIGESGNTLGTSRYLASIYMNMINTDYCRSYIFDRVMEDYTQEQFLEKSGLAEQNPGMTADMVTLKSISEIFHVGLITDASVINMFAETYDQALSSAVVQAASDYLTKELPGQLAPADIRQMRLVDQVLKMTDKEQKLLDSEGTASTAQVQSAGTTPSLKKRALIWGIAVVALYCITVFFIALFRPTMNRRSDFESYGIPVIGEIGRVKKAK